MGGVHRKIKPPTIWRTGQEVRRLILSQQSGVQISRASPKPTTGFLTAVNQALAVIRVIRSVMRVVVSRGCKPIIHLDVGG